MLGLAYTVATLTALYLAWTSGSKELRIVAIVMLVGSAATLVLYREAGSQWLSLNVGVVATDLVAELIFMRMALISKSFWPLWITSMQSGALLSHFSSHFASGLVSYAAGVMQGCWGWMQLALIIIVATRSTHGQSGHLT
jgi:hypothetical protein